MPEVPPPEPKSTTDPKEDDSTCTPAAFLGCLWLIVFALLILIGIMKLATS